MMGDLINHPPHYKLAAGVEVIDLTEQLNFNRGNAVKYLARAGRKDVATEIEDLRKAHWYVERELRRLGHVETSGGAAADKPLAAEVDDVS